MLSPCARDLESLSGLARAARLGCIVIWRGMVRKRTHYMFPARSVVVGTSLPPMPAQIDTKKLQRVIYLAVHSRESLRDSTKADSRASDKRRASIRRSLELRGFHGKGVTQEPVRPACRSIQEDEAAACTQTEFVCVVEMLLRERKPLSS